MRARDIERRQLAMAAQGQPGDFGLRAGAGVGKSMRKVVSAAAISMCCWGCGGQVLEQVGRPAPGDIRRANAVMEYFLPKGIVRVTASYAGAANKPKTLGVQINPIEIVPDASKKFALVYSRAGLSTDEIDIQTENGLLKVASSTSTDQFPEALKSVAPILTQVNALDAAMKINADVPSNGLGDCKNDLFITKSLDLTNKHIEVPYDAAGKEIKEATDEVCSLSLEIKRKVLDPIGLLRANATQRGDAQSDPVGCERVVCFRPTALFRLEVTARLRVRNLPKDGVIYKTTLVPGRNEPLVARAEAEVLAPVGELTGYVRFDRRAFVKNSTTATFSKGMLSGLKSSDPSEVVGFLSVPLEVLKTLTIAVVF
ncbi:MAG: hypothetical protein AB7S92_19925 [Parvibaculaceae bacterium]